MASEPRKVGNFEQVADKEADELCKKKQRKERKEMTK